MEQIKVQDISINITGIQDNDYISLTALARIKNPKEPKDVVKNWMRSRSTLEYLGLWEKMNNLEFRGRFRTPISGNWQKFFYYVTNKMD